jgi:ABC-type transporter Mla subunit MlaD|tara:strand:+ start:458 stop:913 length:456 start_codon:yes stop_codon:yes gene_type:complete
LATKVVKELDHVDSVTINIFAISIIFISIISLYIITNKNENLGNKFEATFNFVGGLTTESKVLISGIEVGNIKNISLLSNNKVLVTGSVDSSYKIPKDSILKINTHGIFGKKYLSILPGYDDYFNDDINFLYTSDSYTIDYLARYLENKKI